MDRRDALALDAADPLAPLRERFVLGDPERLYLDGNSLGRLPLATRDRLAAMVAGEWGQRLVEGWPDWVDLPGRAGDELAVAALGARPGEVVVCDSVTVNLHKLALGVLRAAPAGRRRVVAWAGDFPTDRYVLEGLAGADLRLVGQRTPEAVAGASAAGDVALVVLSHADYRTAELCDLAEVGAAAHAHGALVLWDVSHSAGAVPIELEAAGADLAVGCTYKYLNAGPGAPAFLYVRECHQQRLRSGIWGWFGQDEQFAMQRPYAPATGIARFQAGTPPILGVEAVRCGTALVAEAGIAALGAKARALTGLAIELADAWLAPLGFAVASPRDGDRRGAHVALAHPDAFRICRALLERAGVVPDFRDPDLVRLGFAPLYTRFADVFDALARLRDLVASGGQEAVSGAPTRVT